MHRGDVGLDELHGVVDGHAGRHRPAGAVDVQPDVPLGVLAGQVEQLGADDVGDVVVDLGAEEDDALAQEAVEDLVGGAERVAFWAVGGIKLTAAEGSGVTAPCRTGRRPARYARRASRRSPTAEAPGLGRLASVGSNPTAGTPRCPSISAPGCRRRPADRHPAAVRDRLQGAGQVVDELLVLDGLDELVVDELDVDVEEPPSGRGRRGGRARRRVGLVAGCAGGLVDVVGGSVCWATREAGGMGAGDDDGSGAPARVVDEVGGASSRFGSRAARWRLGLGVGRGLDGGRDGGVLALGDRSAASGMETVPDGAPPARAPEGHDRREGEHRRRSGAGAVDALGRGAAAVVAQRHDAHGSAAARINVGAARWAGAKPMAMLTAAMSSSWPAALMLRATVQYQAAIGGLASGLMARSGSPARSRSSESPAAS